MPWAGILVAIFAGSDPAAERLALVIANNQSLDPEVGPLRFADDFGARLFELLDSLGYDAHLLALLRPETAKRHPSAMQAARRPDQKTLDRVVAGLRERVESIHAKGREVELLVTYSGHGGVGRRGEPFVTLADSRLYRGDLFDRVVAGVGADFSHLLVDACRAADLADLEGGPESPDFDPRHSLLVSPARRTARPEVGMIVAESAAPGVHDFGPAGSTVFGHEVLSGLSGGADVNNDGRIEYSELHAFVAAANASVMDSRRRLRVMVAPPALNPRRALVSLGGPTAAGLRVERIRTPAAGGRWAVVDERGVRWVDLNLTDGFQVLLRLPRRVGYRVLDLASGQEARVEPGPQGATLVLAPLHFESAEMAVRGRAAEAASERFGVSHGRSFYEGFVVAMRHASVFYGPSDYPEPAIGDVAAGRPDGWHLPPSDFSRIDLEEQIRLAAARLVAKNRHALAPLTTKQKRWRTVRYASLYSFLGAAATGGVLALIARKKTRDAAKIRPVLVEDGVWQVGSSIDAKLASTSEAIWVTTPARVKRSRRLSREADRYYYASAAFFLTALLSGALHSVSWMMVD